jgi:pantoate--beta-alanine ligase
MKVIERVAEMQGWSLARRREGLTIGFVPTMGFLHEGHLSLVRLAKAKANIVVVSIFVNPTQFGPTEDLARYPRDLPRDAAMCEAEGVDVIFHPVDRAEMYPPGFQTSITLNEVSRPLCGVSRPTHFAGVATVCCKLFNIVQPHFAVFGEKDYQQLLVIERLVADLNMDLQIVHGLTAREHDGLAMSSRNKYLSPEERAQAPVLQRALHRARLLADGGERRRDALLAAVRDELATAPLGRIDYAELRRLPDLAEAPETLNGEHLLALAVFFGRTRLIDNHVLHVAEPQRNEREND